MKLVSLNIELNKHFERFLSFLLEVQPGVVCMQEVLEEDFNFLQEKIGMPGVFVAYRCVVSNSDHYASLVGKRFGVAIFSKNIQKTWHEFYLGKEENTHVPFDYYKEHLEELSSYVLLFVEVVGGDGKLYRVATTHYPVTVEGESSPFQLALLTPFFEKLDQYKDFILCGDFNAPRGNETFRRIAAHYKDCIPPHYTTSIDQNLHRVKGLQFMVDCLFVTSAYTIENVTLCDGVSDHMAIVAEVSRT